MARRCAHARVGAKVLLAASLATMVGACRRGGSQERSSSNASTSSRTPGPARAADAVAPTGSGAPRADANGTGAAPSPPPTDAAPNAARDASGPRALTIRVINAGDRPFNVYINEDVNEMIHTRRLFPRRNPDASGPMAEGELVKFFVVGEMPLCSSDAGAGYGGLGQPEIRPLAPGQVLEYAWDGWQRVETNMPGRGVCAQLQRPQAARYRFEFDQPGYGGRPQCTRATVELPLAADAGTPVVEIRCLPPRDAGRASDEE